MLRLVCYEYAPSRYFVKFLRAGLLHSSTLTYVIVTSFLLLVPHCPKSWAGEEEGMRRGLQRIRGEGGGFVALSWGLFVEVAVLFHTFSCPFLMDWGLFVEVAVLFHALS